MDNLTSDEERWE